MKIRTIHTRLFLLLVLLLSAIIPATAADTAQAVDCATVESLRALEILDGLMGFDCDDALAYELRGDALSNLGLANESARSYQKARQLVQQAANAESLDADNSTVTPATGSKSPRLSAK